MADIFLGPIVESLLKKLISSPVKHVADLWKVATQLEKMIAILLKIQAVLDDAEAKQITNAAVKTWLNELQHVAYDLEDLVDEFEIESLRLEAEPKAGARTVTTKEVRVHNASSSSPFDVFSCVPHMHIVPSSFRPHAVSLKFKMATELKRINETLERIAKDRDTYYLREGVGVGVVSCGRPTSSLDDKSPVIGREEDKVKLIQQLLQSDDEGSVDEIRVIPIVGMAGVGKTTLARILYNDKAMNQHFNLKAWAYVSQEFDVVRVTQAILESFTANRPQSHEFAPTPQHLDPLQVILKEKLKGNIFLLVLDDVWCIKDSDWKELLKPLTVGATGSKVLVTTRNENFLTTPTEGAYHLKQLGSEDGWSLFSHHAFGNRMPDAFPQLEPIGRQILDKCQGLPLAVITLGCLLHSDVDVKYWEHVLKSEIWDLPVVTSDILPALRLSYYHLPAHLKPCFSYCAIFPKGYEFKSRNLRTLWIAEGLVRPEQNKRVEDISKEYFLDLLSRSFFQEDGHEVYIMHDLIVDLAKFITGEICLKLDELKPNQSITNCRHLSYTSEFFDIRTKFDVVHNAKRLRTLIAPSTRHSGTCYIARQVPSDLVASLKYLRVLHLGGYNISELPDSIGNLKHLRLLDLSRTAISRLPDSICTLHNLMCLVLQRCDSLTELPKDIANLTNLRSLLLYDCQQLKKMPIEMGRLRNLRLLNYFVVGIGNDGGSSIKELKDMDLEGGIELSKLENIADIQDARDANLRNKLNLQLMYLKWSSDKNEVEDSSRYEKDVLDSLEPHTKLEQLLIEQYRGKEFPSWVGHSSFRALHTLVLKNCTKCKSLPPVGQLPSLKVLTITGFHHVKRVGLEFYGVDCPKPFRSLEELTFFDMPEWEEWSGIEEELPCLRKLWVESCPKLRKSSQLFPADLDELKVIDCGELTEFPWLSSLSQDLLDGKREESLVISNCPKLIALPRRLPWVSKVKLANCNEMVLKTKVEMSSVTSFCVSGIPMLRYLPSWFLQCSGALSELEIVGCDYLTALSREGLQHLASLQDLRISGCPQLMCLSEEEEYLPPKLRELKIKDCAKLEKLPNGLQNLSLLKRLRIENCPVFICFPEELFYNTCLEELVLAKCSSLATITRNVRLSHLLNIKLLVIENCENLEALPKGLNNLTRLEYLTINDCPRIVSFPEGGLPTTSLTHLRIDGCENLNSFPDGLRNCTSLVYLFIAHCPASFPEQWLPINLRSLALADCPNSTGLLSKLYEFTSLDSLVIGAFPTRQTLPERMFPTTLRTLGIQGFPNLTHLPKGLCDLASLECLVISKCPKLAHLPKKGLPTSKLSVLGIFDCPKLKRRFQRVKGKDWSKIAHIPLVGIDDMKDLIKDYFFRRTMTP